MFASTGGALYGDAAPLPTPESFAPKPLSPYGASKLSGEAYVATWGRLYGPANVVLRLGNVYGPRQNPHGEAGVVAIFSGLLLDGERAGPARRRKADARLRLRDGRRARRSSPRPTAGAPERTTSAPAARRRRRACSRSSRTRRGPRWSRSTRRYRPGELRSSALDSSLIERELGWRPTVDAETGLRQTFDWYRAARRC